MRVTVAALVVGVLLTTSTAFAADWLPGRSRALPFGDSASPDAPVVSYAYGPRARGTLGGDAALVAFHTEHADVRLGGSALVAFENADRTGAFPDQTLRSVVELGAAWAFPAEADPRSKTRGVLELGAVLGHASAERLGGYLLSDPYHPRDVPFGAGGWYLGIDLAARNRRGSLLVVTARLGFRCFTNFFPDAVGQTEASNVVADDLREGAEFMSWLEVDARLVATPWAQPLLGLYTDVIVPHDDNAQRRWLGRLFGGVAFPGRALELIPFFDGEAGHAQGLLVNRTELRFGVGIRLDAR